MLYTHISVNQLTQLSNKFLIEIIEEKKKYNFLSFLLFNENKENPY